MKRPEAAPVYEDINLKLGIKSSLREVKPTLALLFLLWHTAGKPAELDYSEQQGTGIVLRSDLGNSLYQRLLAHTNTISRERFLEIINRNLLLKSQLEPLKVAFELIWKVAKISFVARDDSGAERTGRARYPKKLCYTLNMDILDMLCAGDPEGYETVLFAWLGCGTAAAPEKEANLIRFLTVIAETAYFKLDDDGNDVVFNLEALYKAVLEGEGPVDVAGDSEARGPLRILKSALSEKLFAGLESQNNQVSTPVPDTLRDYAGRVAAFHQVNPKMYRNVFVPEPEMETDFEEDELSEISFHTGLQSDFPRNRILFGAPGTGKSFTLNREREMLLAEGGEYERVTFHPDYSYAGFVGAYKPVPFRDSEGRDAITYSYVPGPFLRMYVKALRNSRTGQPKPYLLIVEELNRANTAAVFGDVFQLLDRGEDGASEYPIQASEDMKRYLVDTLGGCPDDYKELRLPDNFFLWATMNSADQGVFPLDTAFKRRWDFAYLGIDEGEAGITGQRVILGQGEYRRLVEWNALRKAINEVLLTEFRVNEDKLMGPYFIAARDLPPEEPMDTDAFARIFKNKVIMYLFDDAARQKRSSLFSGCAEQARGRYSAICQEFNIKGVSIFCEAIRSQFIDTVPEGEE